MDFSDPDSPLFCPGAFLLSVAMHIFATPQELHHLNKLIALDLVHKCYMEVQDELRQRCKSR